MQVLNLTQATIAEMLSSTNTHDTHPGVPTSEAAYAQGLIVVPDANYSLYGVSGIYYSGAQGARQIQGIAAAGLWSEAYYTASSSSRLAVREGG